MDKCFLRSDAPVCLIGGGPVGKAALAEALALAPHLVAADSGAATALRYGYMPEVVIGDMDSLPVRARAEIDPARIHQIDEQVTTDFSKAFRSISAPLVLGLGFLGGRIDHELSVFNALMQLEGDCILIGSRDVVFPLRRAIGIEMRPRDRISLFPLIPVTARSEGLEWPLDGIGFAPDGMIGTSNRVVSRHVRLIPEGRGMLCILPRARLRAAVEALRAS